MPTCCSPTGRRVADPDRLRRTFGPVVLVGVAAGALAAVAGGRAWAVVEATKPAPLVDDPDAGKMPLASALAFVVLAAWGVLLVTRGRFRRVVAGIGLAAAVGFSAVVVAGFSAAPDALRGHVHGYLDNPGPQIHLSAWYWISAVAGVLAVVTTAAAVRLVPYWPEMSSRYDAPGAAPVTADPDGPDNSLDLWRAMDQGHDPTLPNDGHRDP